MSNNVLSMEVTQEQVDNVDNLLVELNASLGALVELTIAARRSLVKMGRKNVDFVNRSYRNALINPAYLTGKVSLTELKKDMDLAEWMRKVEKKLAMIFSKVKDTAILAEAEAYQATRLYYNAVKAAARTGDEVAEKISRELSIQYRRAKLPTDEVPPVESPKN
ncbi:MAG TPA: hypothetical protein VK469_22410 [Candidatus Kapabacteria bacterium]|nr:hypothetical protein [Candidatus Kapabacteria bacterium]